MKREKLFSSGTPAAFGESEMFHNIKKKNPEGKKQ